MKKILGLDAKEQKTILGLDLGTNSIGWALVEIDHNKGIVRIISMGSRILPMDAGEINDFESQGKVKSSAALRTEKRGMRRLHERYLLRRDRLHLVLNLLDSLPEHYMLDISFTNSSNKKSGQLKSFKEPKLAYKIGENGKGDFLFKDSYQKMLDDIGIENQKGKRIPYDWTLYYLRQKALSEPISLEELAWVLLSYNQKRGYEKTEVEDKSIKDNEFIEELDLHVTQVEKEVDSEGRTLYDITLDGAISFKYKEYTETQLTFVDDIKEVVKTSKVDSEGNIKDKEVEFTVIDIFNLQISDVKYQKEDGKHNFSIIYDTGWIEVKQPKNFTYKYDKAKGKKYDYIVETKYTHQGEIKKAQGKDRKLREPDFSDKSSDWTLLKKKTEKEALAFNYKKTGTTDKLISPKIYNVLKQDAQTGERTKIIGGMFQVIDREFYRQELKQIINTQRKFHDNLRDQNIFENCVRMLYPNNDTHAKSLLNSKNAIEHLLVEDILLYQRPLKSKKSEISNCKYEIRHWKETVDKSSGEITYVSMYRKVAPASHPLFQEYRIWDKMHSLKLIQLERKGKETGKIATNIDITSEYFNEETYQELFKEFNKGKSINQNQFLNFCKKKFKIDYKLKNSNYVWNFPEDEELKGNQTRVSFVTRFKRCGFADYKDFLTKEKEVKLWHYLYSVNYKERVDNNHKSIKTFFTGYFKDWDINEEVKNKVIKDFTNYPKFSSQYCAFSEKSLKKFIPYLRIGNETQMDYWANEDWYVKWKEQQEDRKQEILNKLEKLDFSAEDVNYDDVIEAIPQNNKLPFPKGLFNVFKGFSDIAGFQKLNVSQAAYLIYGRHSELAQVKYWNSPEDIRNELHKELKQHSMNNPIAEKVLLEMMQVVADIWEYHGKSEKDYFSEIHVEVGRELKKSAKEKKRDTDNQKINREQNKRLRQVLEEFLCCAPYNANPKNKDHFERLKIVEDSALNQHQYHKKAERDEMDKVLKNPITKETFEKYKLWVEQGYKSPYTNRLIAMTDLFDGTKYNIDHIFPQASVTNNSLSNKVVCEREVNKEKSNKTGREFINNPGEREIYCSAHNENVKIISDDEYVASVLKLFSGSKKHILLSREIPKGFTNSQLNNARHISRKAMELLSHIVREEGELEFCSKNVLPVTGRITADLKRVWQLNEVWTDLVSPRFIRMNELTKSNLFGQLQLAKNGKEFFNCNLNKTIREKDESYDIKRIDHRHHALDALIVALCTREHVNYMNNINSQVDLKDIGKQKQLEAYRLTMKRNIMFSASNKENPKDNDWHFMRPGEKRKQDANNSKENTVLNKKYLFNDVLYYGNWKAMVLDALQNTVVTFKQNLRVINKTVNRYKKDSTNNESKQSTKNEQKYNWAIRRSLGKDTFYGRKTIKGVEKIVVRESLDDSFKRKKIETITDSGIQKILGRHLAKFDTVKLPFAKDYVEDSIEKTEIWSIVADSANDFNSLEDFAIYLEDSKYKFNKTDYSKLNVFIDKMQNSSFVRENTKKTGITEHPEFAFTPEEIEALNQPESLKELNKGKAHAPIKKVRISRGFGKQRQVCEDEDKPVNYIKKKQYIVSDAGSNLYLGFYTGHYFNKKGEEVRGRKIEDINLVQLIEELKYDKDKRKNPFPSKIYDSSKDIEYNWMFTISPLDLVYVPTQEEIDQPHLVDHTNLSHEQVNRIYKFVDGGGGIVNFIPYAVAKPIWKFHENKKKKEIYEELLENNMLQISEDKLIKDEFGFGSQQTKNQNMDDGKTQIKTICWKLEIDRLGNITKIVKYSNVEIYS